MSIKDHSKKKQAVGCSWGLFNSHLKLILQQIIQGNNFSCQVSAVLFVKNVREPFSEEENFVSWENKIVWHD